VTEINNQQAPDNADGPFVTVRVREITKPGAARKGKPMFASGLLVLADKRSIVLRVERQIGFPIAKMAVTDMKLDRHRILSSSRPLPDIWPVPTEESPS
jgi:hypothetical protein